MRKKIIFTVIFLLLLISIGYKLYRITYNIFTPPLTCIQKCEQLYGPPGKYDPETQALYGITVAEDCPISCDTSGDYCETDAQCYCKDFLGLKQYKIDGRIPQKCNVENHTCSTCTYR